LAIVYWIVANDQHMLSALTWFFRAMPDVADSAIGVKNQV